MANQISAKEISVSIALTCLSFLMSMLKIVRAQAYYDPTPKFTNPSNTTHYKLFSYHGYENISETEITNCNGVYNNIFAGTYIEIAQNSQALHAHNNRTQLVQILERSEHGLPDITFENCLTAGWNQADPTSLLAASLPYVIALLVIGCIVCSGLWLAYKAFHFFADRELPPRVTEVLDRASSSDDEGTELNTVNDLNDEDKSYYTFEP